MDGLISNIQKFSLDDGPGIRTTVFLKGCNFKCIWCHNPEAISFQAEELFYAQKCIHCGHCQDGCPTGARHMVGEARSPQSVFEEVISDLEYYKASGGGITDTEDNLKAIIHWLKDLRHLRAWEILNYNVLAKAKYEPLRQKYQLPNAQPLSLERINEIKKLAAANGISSIFNPK